MFFSFKHGGAGDLINNDDRFCKPVEFRDSFQALSSVGARTAQLKFRTFASASCILLAANSFHACFSFIHFSLKWHYYALSTVTDINSLHTQNAQTALNQIETLI